MVIPAQLAGAESTTAKVYPAPRWQTPLPAGVVGSWGPDVDRYARVVLGVQLDRWQRRVLNRALAIGADGRLVHRVYIASTARQNGKSLAVRALVGWALTASASPPWSYVLGLAHDRTQARIPYAAILVDLGPLAARLGSDRRGGLALTRYLGIRSGMFGRHREYHTASRDARNAIRGMSVDLGIFDEIRTQVDDSTWAALAPTTTARPDPLIFGISTAGDDRSVLLRRLFERGRRIIDGAEPGAGFGLTWYAAPDDADPEDPRGHRLASPAIADGRLDPQVIARDVYDLAPSAFRQERLNLWADAADEWLPLGTWTRTIGPQPLQLAPSWPVALGVDVAPTWRRASVAVAVAPDEGPGWAGLVADLDAGRQSPPAAAIRPEALLAALDLARASWRPRSIVYSQAGAAAAHLTAWAAEHDVTAHALGGRELRAASEGLRAGLIAGRIAHADDPLLGLAVRAARPSGPIAGGDWYLSVRASTGEIDAVRALAWACLDALGPAVAPVVPQIFL